LINKILLLTIISLPLFSSSSETDIFPRVFNFVIFAYIIYYLVYDKAVSFLKERSKNIDSKIKESENKLEALKKEEKASKNSIKKAETKSLEIIEDAKNTVKLIQAKIKKDTTTRIEDLNKSYENKADVANKKASIQTVEEVLSENIFSKSIDSLSQDVIVELINKKVA
jgi:F-type H+-transporting ATPase subunit b